MKKVISLLCVMVMVFAFAGCAARETPDVVVKEFCDALKNADLEAMEMCMEGNETAPTEMDEDDVPQAVLDAMKDNAQKITYTLGKVTAEETTGRVCVDFQYPDISDAVTAALSEYVAKAFGMAMSGAEEEELSKLLETILTEKITEGEPDTAEVSVTFDCVMTDEGWKIESVPDDVFHVMTGNLMKAFEEIAESFQPTDEQP